MPRRRGRETAEVGEIVAWLEHGHSHGASLAQLITKGPDAVAAKCNGGEPLRLDG